MKITRRKIWTLLASAAASMGIGVHESHDPHLLWAPESQSHMESVREMAQKLARPIEAQNQRPNTIFELDAWVDHVTDSILLKAYRRDNMHMPVRSRGEEIGLGIAITRKNIQDKSRSELETLIVDAWHQLTKAVNDHPYNDKPDAKIMSLAQLKVGSV